MLPPTFDNVGTNMPGPILCRAGHKPVSATKHVTDKALDVYFFIKLGTIKSNSCK